MKNQKKPAKLALARTTVKLLSEHELRPVAGGGTNSCVVTCVSTCPSNIYCPD
jgi:hypothetical protein